MTDTTTLSLADLKLTAAEREKIADTTGDLIAIHVYRELQKAYDAANKASGSETGGVFIGNCSSSSKDALMGRAAV
jgi:hypothetical protein